MIRPQHSYLHEQLLNIYLDKKFKQRFSSVNFILTNEIRKDHSLLLIGNHSTWWDGFLIYQFNRKILQKTFHVMMLETQLKALWFLQKVGCFSIDPGSKSVIESLNFASELLNHPKNMVLFYPQGRFYSLIDQDFHFNKGVDIALKKAPQADIMFYALFSDFGKNEKPYLNIYFKVIENAVQYDYKALEFHYKSFYEESKLSHIANFVP